MHKNLENKVVYQIYPKSYNDTTGNGFGDLRGIIQKLDYLKDLGVDYIWLSPICKSPQHDNGYDIADYYTIDPRFGTNADYEELIAEAKKRDMKIMMDLVLNHTSNEHEWFKKALQKDEKYYNYYIFRDEPNDIGSYFSGKAWTYSEEVGQYYFRLFDTTQPDLNWENKEVRDDIYEMVNYWIEKGVEGFRLDVIDLIGKEPDNMITGKGPKFYEYLKELSNTTFKDELLTVGECWGSSLEESYNMCNKDALTQAFHFHQMSVVEQRGDKWLKQGADLNKLADILNTWQNEYTGIEAIVTGNHDLPRLISNWFNDTTYRKESAKLAITLFGLLKGNLYIYQGEEIGATNAYMDNLEDYNDVETLNKYKDLVEEGFEHKIIMEMIKKTSRDNGRVPMQWNAEENAGFTTGTPWLKVNRNYKEVNVEKDLNSEDSVYAYYQDIIKFRKENYDLINQNIEITVNGKIFEFTKGDLHFVANCSEFVTPFEKDETAIFTNYKKELNGYLRPYEVRVSKK